MMSVKLARKSGRGEALISARWNGGLTAIHDIQDRYRPAVYFRINLLGEMLGLTYSMCALLSTSSSGESSSCGADGFGRRGGAGIGLGRGCA